MKTVGRTGIVAAGCLLHVLLWAAGCSDDPADRATTAPAGGNSGNYHTLDLGRGATMQFVLIPAGKFIMGSPTTAPGRGDDEGPRRHLAITRPFLMGRTEVTRGQFAAFAADSGYRTTAETAGWAYAFDGSIWREVNGISWRNPGFRQTDAHPVVCVSWVDASAFCAWLGGKTGQAVSLPTEAQWEYACRGGTAARFGFGDNGMVMHRYANYCDRSCTLALAWRDADHDDGHDRTAPVGRYQANLFGLYDMHGNAWEWCRDWYAERYAGADVRDPTGPSAGTARVLRGGSWYGPRQLCRAAYRLWDLPNSRNCTAGFRVVVSVQEKGDWLGSALRSP